MSFLDGIIRSIGTRPAAATLTDELFPLSVDPARNVRRQQERQQSTDRYYEDRARRDAITAEATSYWQEQMTKLADQHSAAVSNALSSGQDMSEYQLQNAVQAHDKKLKLAQGLLLQQSDTRWGKKITNKALKALNHSSLSFRIDAG